MPPAADDPPELEWARPPDEVVRPGVRPREHRRDLTRVARQSYLQFGSAIVNGILGFILVVTATRALGKTQAGAFLVGIGLFQIVANLAQLGADTGLVRMIPRYRALGRPQDVRRTLKIGLVPVLVLGSGLGVAIFFAAPFLANVLSHRQDPQVVLPYLRVLAPFIPFAAISTVALAGTRGFGTVVPFAIVENVGKPAARPPLLLVAVALGVGTAGIAMSYALPVLAGAIVGVGWLLWLEERSWRREQFDRSAPRAYRELASEFWRFSSPRALMGFFGTTATWIDTLLLSGLRSTGEAGVYTAATRFMLVGQAALQAINLVIAPHISAFLATGERDRAQSIYQVSTWWLMAFTWPAYIAMAIYAPLLLKLFGRGFGSGTAALVILSLASLANMATGPVGTVILMGGYSFLGMVIGACSLALNIGMNLILIPRYGMTGAAIAWAVSIVLNNITVFVLAKWLMKMGALGRGFVVVAAASLLCYGGFGLVARALLGTTLASFVTYGIVSTLSYAFVLYRSRRLLHLSVLREALRTRRTGVDARGGAASGQ